MGSLSSFAGKRSMWVLSSVALSLLLFVLVYGIARSGIPSASLSVSRELQVVGPWEDPAARRITDMMQAGADDSALRAVIDENPQALAGHVQALGTPLHACVVLMRPELVSLFLDYGSSPLTRTDLLSILESDPGPFQRCGLSSASALELAVVERDLSAFWTMFQRLEEDGSLSADEVGRLSCLAKEAGQVDLASLLEQEGALKGMEGH